MVEHTPGPWRYTLDARGRHLVVPENKWGHALAQVFVRRLDPCIYPVQQNARLIAAAPELLEALEELWTCVELQDEFSDPISDRYVVGHMVQDVIAKTRGESA